MSDNVAMSSDGYRNRKDSQNNARKRRQEKVAACIATLSILLSVVCITATLVTFMRNYDLGFSGNSGSKSPIACVPCERFIKVPMSHLGKDPLLSKLTVELGEGGVKNCCAYNSDQISSMLELTMRRRESQVESKPLPMFDPKNFSFSPVSAHKKFLKPSLKENHTLPYFEEGNQAKIRFNTEIETHLEHVRDVRIEEEGVEILHSGQYFVYTSIHFRPESPLPCRNFKFQIWGHYVVKTRLNYPGAKECLLQTSHTCCDNCTHADETSFTSGVFNLSKGDMVKVNVSGHGLVNFKTQSSYLGLMLLGNIYD